MSLWPSVETYRLAREAKRAHREVGKVPSAEAREAMREIKRLAGKRKQERRRMGGGR